MVTAGTSVVFELSPNQSYFTYGALLFLPPLTSQQKRDPGSCDNGRPDQSHRNTEDETAAEVEAQPDNSPLHYYFFSFFSFFFPSCFLWSAKTNEKKRTRLGEKTGTRDWRRKHGGTRLLIQSLSFSKPIIHHPHLPTNQHPLFTPLIIRHPVQSSYDHIHDASRDDVAFDDQIP